VSKDQHHLLVLNHFALPRHRSGGTRHVDLCSRLEGWSATILASNRNYFSGAKERGAADLLRYIWTTPPADDGWGRVLHWMSYVLPAIVAGLREPRPSVVYASTPHLFTPSAGWVLARRYRVPLVIEVRDLWPQVLVDMGRLAEGALLHRMLKALEEWSYRRADAIVVMAEGIREELTRRGIPAERLHFIPNGAEPADFKPSADRATLRARYHMDGLVFVYTGAHGPANGLDLLLDAAKEVAGDLPEVRIVLVGDGPDRQRLRDRVATEAIVNVRFLDPIPKDEIPDLLAAADVGMHVLADVPLFRYGVSPNKVVDYMAAGRPVITNTPGEVAALVETAQAGVAVPPTGLASAIRQVAGAGPDQRQRWGENGRAYVEKRRSPTVLAQQLEALLDALLRAARLGTRGTSCR
jgi:glycosyltransferase involved in cell wall biosynthesis